MRTRTITVDEFIKLTRGTPQYVVKATGETSFYEVVIPCIDNSLSLSYGGKFQNGGVKISHLKLISIDRYGIRTHSVTLDKGDKRDLFKILKKLASIV